VGATLAKAALTAAAFRGVGHAAARMLVGMAVTTLDPSDRLEPGEAGTYYAGRTMLAQFLGYLGDDAETQAARKAVARCTAELVHRGLLVRTRQAFNRDRSTYSLAHLLTLDALVDNQGPPAVQLPAERPPQLPAERPPIGTRSQSAQVPAERPPK